MTKIFRKYESTPTEWETLRKLIEQTITNPDGEPVTSWKDCAVVELGFLPITPAVLSDKWAVDILFYTEPPAEFTPFEVWPTPCGIHVFSGDESLYLAGYCAKFPESPYCKLPELVTQVENN